MFCFVISRSCSAILQEDALENRAYRWVWAFVSFILIVTLSCATPQKQLRQVVEQQSFKGIGESLGDLGKIGIVSASFRPRLDFQKPLTRGTAAMVGALSAVGFLATGGSHCVGDECLGILILIPAAGMIGGIVGAIRGVSRGELQRHEAALNDYAGSLDFQKAMAEGLFSVAQEQSRLHLILLEVQGPNVPGEETTYHSSQFEQVDAILEMGVRECRLRGTPAGINSPLHLTMTVGTRLIRAKDGTVLCRSDFTYEQGVPRIKFSEWGAKSAQAFREELDRAFRHLAVEIVTALSEMKMPFDLPSQSPPN